MEKYKSEIKAAIMNCPLLDIKTNRCVAGLPDGCPLKATHCPIIELKTNRCVAGLPDGCPLKATHYPIMKPPEYGYFTDPRDGRTYKTVKIGTQTWMAENLNFDYKGSKSYKNLPEFAEKYGRLYDWETAKKAVPPGWHLPTREEWQMLVDFVGGEKVAGTKLKAKSGWNNNGNGTDDYGFSALPGGDGGSGGSFYYVGSSGLWWSASEDTSIYAYYRYMIYDGEGALWSNYSKSFLFSVRCLQDTP